MKSRSVILLALCIPKGVQTPCLIQKTTRWLHLANSTVTNNSNDVDRGGLLPVARYILIFMNEVVDIMVIQS
ncbi:hypothetical protein F4775DRAFT_564295 [Biscogniauxia sp. FL1348]|nr:hypothetical protein F4775DRAFT_564295 [Biscogniauxia sp. FL1348]